MPFENVERFNIGVLRAIAFLYRNFPNVTTVRHATLCKITKADDDSVVVELENGAEHGTIRWLSKNGFVDGELEESNPLEGGQTAKIRWAQLSPRALRILQKPERDAGGIPLGEFAVASAFGTSEAASGEIVVRRLLE